MIILIGSKEIRIKVLTEDIAKMMKFEGARLQSLLERGIPPVSESREWDRTREITVSSRLYK